jgi:tRNA(Ile)-lysidine synthase
LPLLYRGDELVWVPGLGIDARYRAGEKRAGWIPEWRLTC